MTLTPQPYGLLTASGLLLAYAIVVCGARRLRVREYDVAIFFLCQLVAALVGARIFAGEGFSSAGALIGVCVTAPIVLLTRGIAPLPFLAMASPAAALGLAMTRIGCFVEGCCEGVAGHPTPLYESGALVLLAFALPRRRRPVTVLSLWLVGVATERFLAEFLRADGVVLGPTQVVCLALGAASFLAGCWQLLCGPAPVSTPRIQSSSGSRTLAPSVLDEPAMTVEVEMPASS